MIFFKYRSLFQYLLVRCVSSVSFRPDDRSAVHRKRPRYLSEGLHQSRGEQTGADQAVSFSSSWVRFATGMRGICTLSSTLHCLGSIIFIPSGDQNLAPRGHEKDFGASEFTEASQKNPRNFPTKCQAHGRSSPSEFPAKLRSAASYFSLLSLQLCTGAAVSTPPQSESFNTEGRLSE